MFSPDDLFNQVNQQVNNTFNMVNQQLGQPQHNQGPPPQGFGFGAPPPGFQQQQQGGFQQQQQQQPNAAMQMLNKDSQEKPKGKKVHPTSFFVNQNGIKAGEYMQSTFNKYYLTVTEDGNMVCYSHYSFEPQYAYWQTGTSGTGCQAFVDKKGNFNLVNSQGHILWQTMTHNQVKGNSYKLKIHDDGHLELTSGTKNIWKTSPGPKK